MRLFEKRKGSTQQTNVVIGEKEEKQKKDIELCDRNLKPPKNAKAGVGRAAKLANPLRSQADLNLTAPEEHAERIRTFGFSSGTKIPDGMTSRHLFAAVGAVETSF